MPKREREAVPVDLNEEAISVLEDEETIPLTPTLLTSVEHVYLIPPPNRYKDFCCIFGDISVTDDLNKPAVTLFSRRRDNFQVLDLAESFFCYPHLTHHVSDRALSADSDNYVTLHLYEKMNAVKLVVHTDGKEKEEDPDGGNDQMSSQGEEDQMVSEEEDPDGEEDHNDSEEEDPNVVQLLHIEQFKFKGIVGQISNIRWEGKSGIKFRMRHAAILGVRVRVDVTINRVIKLETGIVESICGRIAAEQHMDAFKEADVRLFSTSMREPTMFRVGEPIPFDRHTVVAPIADGWLSIALDLWSGDGETSLVEDELVHFAILPTDNHTFLTNKHKKHTKQVVDGLFSVSITFVD